jgi:hypothetical protein
LKHESPADHPADIAGLWLLPVPVDQPDADDEDTNAMTMTSPLSTMANPPPIIR